jgi:metallo-beta-lactamase family protein
MAIKLSFLGAARSVTGSRYLVEANGTKVLVDCGMYQERQFRARDWSPFPVNPRTIEAVLLTHAHLDHCGLLPKLVKDGFHRAVHCTQATRELAEIILMDSARLMTEDADFKRRRHKNEGRTGPYPELPLYTTYDVEACLPRFVPARYRKPVKVARGIEATFFDAGHTLGSAMLQLCVTEEGKETTLLFSGDMGRPGKPILMDPTVFKEADYVVVESTYGDRLLDPPEDMAGKMAEQINWAVGAGGNVVIPSFALERTQEVMYYLNELLLKDAIPHLVVFLDSPMAAAITEVFRHHHELMDAETLDLIRHGNSPFDFPGFTEVKTPDESKAINQIRGTAVIIAGSGMCTGGRIKHHLVANISRPDSVILFVGYQAAGTLGREIVDGATEVRILGQQHPVKARVVYLHGFSGHADREQLLSWLLNLRKPPKGVFVTHGESSAAEGFAGLLGARTGWPVTAPEYGDEVVLA